MRHVHDPGTRASLGRMQPQAHVDVTPTCTPVFFLPRSETFLKIIIAIFFFQSGDFPRLSKTGDRKRAEQIKTSDQQARSCGK